MDVLGVEQMKKIANDIMDEELGKYNIKSAVFPVTFIEYYKDYVFAKPFKLIEKVSFSLAPFTSGGFYNLKSKDIVLFLPYSNKIVPEIRSIFNLVKKCYHELRHIQQESFDSYSYEGFLKDIELYIKGCDNFDYLLAHDKYSFEIGANLYSVYKGRDYLIDKFPNLYQMEKENIDLLENRYIYDYLTYDAVDVVDRFLSLCKIMEGKVNGNNKIIKSNIKKVDVSPVLDIFLDDNHNFKRISEIANNERFSQLDQRIISSFFCCRTFLSNINMAQLSKVELELVINALNYRNSIYQNQARLVESKYKKNKISLLQYLKCEKNLIGKMLGINKYVDILLKNKFANYYRNENKRLENARNISYHLNKCKRLIKQKGKNGFIVYDFLYIVGLIVTVITLLCIYLR